MLPRYGVGAFRGGTAAMRASPCGRPDVAVHPRRIGSFDAVDDERRYYQRPAGL